MKTKMFLATLCSWLLINASLVWAADPVAMGKLDTKGSAEVNGTLAPAEITLFAGDRIVTREDATAMVSLTGGSQLILVGPGALQMIGGGRQSTVSLSRGELAVLSRASMPVAVEAGGVRIHAGNAGAVYAVTIDAINLKVIASKGSAEVEAGDRAVTVTEGKTLEATLAPPQGPAGARPSGEVSKFMKILIITSAAASITALVIAVKKLTESCQGTPSPFSVTCN